MSAPIAQSVINTKVVPTNHTGARFFFISSTIPCSLRNSNELKRVKKYDTMRKIKRATCGKYRSARFLL